MRRLRWRWLLVSLLASSLSAPLGAQAQDAPAHCAPVSAASISALFDRWNAALASGDPDTVTATYAPDAVLLPTLQNGPLIGRTAIRGYFLNFLKKHPQGAIDSRTIGLGCNIAYDVGTYTFMVDGPTPGTHALVHARYTYIYEPLGGSWLIVHHHSSRMPAGAD